MAKKSSHPDLDIFDYLSGALNPESAREVEQHMQGCKDCASMADLIGAMRQSRAESDKDPEAHPDVERLAGLFYGRPRADNRETAAHVATCRSCAREMAEYARAERAATAYNVTRTRESEVPAAAWQMIRDWNESNITRPRSLSREEFAAMAELLSRRKDELRELAREHVTQRLVERGKAEFEADITFPDKLVPVIIVDRSGQFRGVEMFEKVSDQRGASVLKQVEKTNRFDKKPFQAFLDFGEKSYVVISDLVRRDTVRLQHVTHPDRQLRDADYFIIEE